MGNILRRGPGQGQGSSPARNESQRLISTGLQQKFPFKIGQKVRKKLNERNQVVSGDRYSPSDEIYEIVSLRPQDGKCVALQLHPRRGYYEETYSSENLVAYKPNSYGPCGDCEQGASSSSPTFTVLLGFLGFLFVSMFAPQIWSVVKYCFGFVYDVAEWWVMYCYCSVYGCSSNDDANQKQSMTASEAPLGEAAPTPSIFDAIVGEPVDLIMWVWGFIAELLLFLFVVVVLFLFLLWKITLPCRLFICPAAAAADSAGAAGTVTAALGPYAAEFATVSDTLLLYLPDGITWLLDAFGTEILATISFVACQVA